MAIPEKILHTIIAKKVKPMYYRDVNGDWQKILIIFMILALGVFAAGLYFFLRLNSGDIFMERKTEPVTSEIINSEKLKQINAYYDARATKFEQGIASSTTSIDPS